MLKTLLFSLISLASLLLTHAAIAVSPDCLDAFRNTALGAHNDYRAKHGVPPLFEDANIDIAAQNSATIMGATNAFMHTPNLNKTGENLYAVYTTTYPTLTQCARKNLNYLLLIF